MPNIPKILKNSCWSCGLCGHKNKKTDQDLTKIHRIKRLLQRRRIKRIFLS